MRVFVTGAAGLLGREVCDQVEEAGHEVLRHGHEFDISDPEATARIAVSDFGQIDWLINCAAFTAVDAAEENAQAAYEANGLGPSYLGQACKMANVKLLHISTDFVFDGEADVPYTEENATSPLNSYGRSKLAGENALAGNHLAVTVRTSWLFGPRGKCFPRSILAAFDAGRPLKVVADQFGTPTYTPFLADRLVQVIERNPFPGLYHLAGSEVMSWHQFAQQTLKSCGRGWEGIEPISTDQWPTPARRPRYSALCSDKIYGEGIERMPPLSKALADFCGRCSVA